MGALEALGVQGHLMATHYHLLDQQARRKLDQGGRAGVEEEEEEEAIAPDVLKKRSMYIKWSIS